MYSVLTFLFSSIVFAQSVTPFDMLEASRLANEIDRAFRKINGTMSSISLSKCETVTSTSGESIATCTLREEDFNTPIFKEDYEPNQIPTLIKENLPEQFVKDSRDKKVSCVYRVKLSNDNQQMVGRSAEKKSIKNNTYGDDFGRTHGLDVGVSCASSDGVSNAFAYSTELYSDADRLSAQRLASGNVSMKQKFTSENIFSLLQDNINQGKVTYWKRGIGFINLSEKKKWGFLQSTGQQEWFHGVVNRVSKGSAYEYEYEEGSKDKWGGFVMLAVGLQENRKLGDRCTLKLSADVGARLSTLKGTSTLNLNLQAEMAYQVTDKASVYLRAQSETTVRSDSRITENTLAAGIRSRAGNYVEIGATAQSGNRNDVQDSRNFYTGKNDLQVFLKVGKHF